MLADADARADETALPVLSVLTILEISEAIDEEIVERTLEAAGAARPLVGAGEAVAESPVVSGRGTIVKLESVDEATGAVPDETGVETGRSVGVELSVSVSVADGTSVAVADGALVSVSVTDGALASVGVTDGTPVSVPVAIGTMGLSVVD